MGKFRKGDKVKWGSGIYEVEQCEPTPNEYVIRSQEDSCFWVRADELTLVSFAKSVTYGEVETPFWIKIVALISGCAAWTLWAVVAIIEGLVMESIAMSSLAILLLSLVLYTKRKDR